MGVDRPPGGTTGRLYRIEDGRATPEPFVRLHPAAPNPLGELWGPVGSPAPSPAPGSSASASPSPASPADGNGLSGTIDVGATGPTWTPGHYLIELDAPNGEWVRWLGLDIRLSPPVVEPASTPAASREPAASGAPATSPRPSAAP